jgi:hypothetical protein
VNGSDLDAHDEQTTPAPLLPSPPTRDILPHERGTLCTRAQSNYLVVSCSRRPSSAVMRSCVLLGVVLLAVVAVSVVQADVYLNMPRGSNNRLDEANRDRDNGDRLFDSQVSAWRDAVARERRRMRAEFPSSTSHVSCSLLACPVMPAEQQSRRIQCWPGVLLSVSHSHWPLARVAVESPVLPPAAAVRHSSSRMLVAFSSCSPSTDTGSTVTFEWTAQHSCGDKTRANCELIVQYACDDRMRDGTTTTTIPTNPNQCYN